MSKKPNKQSRYFVAMQIQTKITVDPPVPIKFPDGCAGVLFAFKTKKAGKEFLGNDVDFFEITS